jgi:hypothetical protein
VYRSALLLHYSVLYCSTVFKLVCLLVPFTRISRNRVLFSTTPHSPLHLGEFHIINNNNATYDIAILKAKFYRMFFILSNSTDSDIYLIIDR